MYTCAFCYPEDIVYFLVVQLGRLVYHHKWLLSHSQRLRKTGKQPLISVMRKMCAGDRLVMPAITILFVLLHVLFITIVLLLFTTII